MERKKNLFVVFLLTCWVTASAQNESEIYKAYISNNMAMWKKIIDKMENENEKSNAMRITLLNYQYGYIGWCIGQEKADTAKKYIELASNHISILEKNNYKPAITYAYKSAFVGFNIGLYPYKAPFIGLNSKKFANRSVNLDINNALGYVQLGNIEFYMPSIFGGSKETAIKYYLKALKIMENGSVDTTYDWNYLSLLATVINAYIEIEDYAKAKEYCLKTLKTEPDFDWVKNELYPKTLKYLKQ